MLPKKTLLAVAVIGVIAIMLLPSSVIAANPSNPYNVFEPGREDQNIGFERDGRTIYSDGTGPMYYRANVEDSKSSHGIYLMVDTDWNDINLNNLDIGHFDIWITRNVSEGPGIFNVRFTIQPIGPPERLAYYLSCTSKYDVIVKEEGRVNTTVPIERIYISIESYETTSHNYLSMKYWTDETSYTYPIGYVQIRRPIPADDVQLCIRNYLGDKNGHYVKTTIKQFDDPYYPPGWRNIQTVTAEYDTYDPWTMIQRVTTNIEMIIPNWKELQTVSTDIVSQLLKWMSIQNVFTSIQVQFPVWTMIQKIGHHLTVTSLMSQGLNFIILMIFILLPSLIAYAIVGRPGLLIGLMTTTILWTINEPQFLTSAFVIWATCAVVLWRSIR